jgi:hypothetical protein
MNRIILIGNGFDLAHGLKTKYTQFIDDYWKKVIKKAFSISPNHFYENGITIYGIERLGKRNYNGYSTFKQDIEHYIETHREDSIKFLEFHNKFFEKLCDKTSLQNWVDIEIEYYDELLICLKSYDIVDSIKRLNKEFKEIENLLIKYLLKRQNEIPNKIQKKKDFVQNIGNIIYSDISLRDLIEKGRSQIEEFTFNKYIAYRSIYTIKGGNDQIHLNVPPNPTMVKFDQDVNKQLLGDLNPDNSKRIINNYLINGFDSVKFALQPDCILFLTFNYTNTEKFYIKPENVGEQGKDCQVIHVHGILEKKEGNPIIFGYGDELDDDYKLLEKANNNEYLENIKSIKYLETSNYKQLLNFINADQYQVFIFGHSCGISDRTLLNTLFEHENCVSIKPFYYQIDDKRDNYSDIVRNISRNFNNKASMRDKVVNKTYCEPLGGK